MKDAVTLVIVWASSGKWLQILSAVDSRPQNPTEKKGLLWKLGNEVKACWTYITFAYESFGQLELS